MTTIAAETLQQEIYELEEWLLLNPKAEMADRVEVRMMIVRKRIQLNELNK